VGGCELCATLVLNASLQCSCAGDGEGTVCRSQSTNAKDTPVHCRSSWSRHDENGREVDDGRMIKDQTDTVLSSTFSGSVSSPIVTQHRMRG